MKRFIVLPLTVALAEAAQENGSPVKNVVGLLKEMAKTLKKEQTDDDALWEKTKCWCDLNKKHKKHAINEHTLRISNLENAINQFGATIVSKQLQIEDHEKRIAAAQTTIKKLTKIRENEHATFLETEKDLETSIASLTEALKVLGDFHGKHDAKTHGVDGATSFLQVADKLKNSAFADKLNADLWDFLGQMPASAQQSRKDGFLQAEPTDAMSDEQKAKLKELEDKASVDLEARGAHGSDAYNSRSGKITGMIEAMNDKFTKELADSRKDEAQNLALFNDIVAAKKKEIHQLDRRLNHPKLDENEADVKVKSLRKELADAKAGKAKAEAELIVAKEQLAADEAFLQDVEDKCTSAENAWEERSYVRGNERNTILQAVDLLGGASNKESEARRSHMTGTFSFLQMASKNQGTSKNELVNRLMQLSREKHNKQLALYAMEASATTASTFQDTIKKIEKAMKDMIEALQSEATGDVAKKKGCEQDQHKNKMNNMDRTNDKKVAETQIELLDAKLKKVEGEIKNLQAEIKEEKKQVQIAGFARAEENKEFQTTVHDQTLTQGMLQKAIEVLKGFYESPPDMKLQGLLQADPAKEAYSGPDNRVGASRDGDRIQSAEEAGTAYAPSGGAEGVLVLLDNILANANEMTANAYKEEQASHAEYQTLMEGAGADIDSANAMIIKKQADHSDLMGEKTAQTNAKTTAEDQLVYLGENKSYLHNKCDFLLNNWDDRMQARQDEVEGLQQAMGILAGAEFQNLTLHS